MEILVITFIAGLICFILPRRVGIIAGGIAFLASGSAFYFSIRYFISKQINCPVLFSANGLNLFIIFFIGLFGFIISLYSLPYAEKKIKNATKYYAYLLWTLCVSCGAVLTNNMALFLFMWGAGALFLYMLVGIQGDEESSAAGKKTFIIVGGSDAIMFLGAAILWKMTGTLNMDNMQVAISGKLALAAFLCLLIGAMAKAGAIPFHTWIPDASKAAPSPVAAILPASLDKLLGIYLLVKCSLYMFIVPKNSLVSLFLMVIGAITIICAVMMALVQHDIRRLLAYHAVSQVGYMILGIGIATPLGIAGGLFHMVNHAIYKSCLFLTAGNVEYRTNRSELSSLGGLAVSMPVTFFACLVASLSISGIPPFNGFFSKWMIYQALIQGISSPGGHFTIFLCLIIAMFASALTLASFMKLLHAVFLGQPSANRPPIKEAPWQMWLPVLFLSLLCILFGVFAVALPLKYFIIPAIGSGSLSLSGYAPVMSVVLMAIGIIAGLICYILSGVSKSARGDSMFVGGEVIPCGNRVSGVEFYNAIKELPVLKNLYARAEKGLFDIYEQGKVIVFGAGKFFQYLHNGVLPTYLVWTLLGMIVIFFVLQR